MAVERRVGRATAQLRAGTLNPPFFVITQPLIFSTTDQGK